MRASPCRLPAGPASGGRHPTRPARLSLRAASLAVAALLIAAPATHAQYASLSGIVRDEGGRPVGGATVAAIGTSVRAETGPDGRFELRLIPPGARVIQVQRFGYASVQDLFTFRPGDRLEQSFRILVEAIAVDPLEVRARPAIGMSPQLRGFYERKERGEGHFYTREDIERMQARQFTDVLRRVPGARIVPVAGPYGTSYVVSMGRAYGVAGPRDCSVLYYMNGQPFIVAADVGINTYVRPEDVAAVEVYAGSARLPSQFSSTSNNSRCGVVVIWTYSGPGRSGSGSEGG